MLYRKRYKNKNYFLRKKSTIFLKDPFFPVILLQQNSLRILPLIGKENLLNDDSRFYNSSRANIVIGMLIFVLIITMLTLTASAKTSARQCSIYSSMGHINNIIEFKNYSVSTTPLGLPNTKNTKVSAAVGNESLSNPNFFQNNVTKPISESFQENTYLGNSSKDDACNERSTEITGTLPSLSSTMPGCPVIEKPRYRYSDSENVQLPLTSDVGVEDSQLPLTVYGGSSDAALPVTIYRGSISTLESSPVKPQGMLDKDYAHFCSLAATKACQEHNISLAEIIVLAQLARGPAGENITILGSISGRVPWLKGIIDMRCHFDPKELAVMSPLERDAISHTSLKKGCMQFYERFNVSKYNSSVENLRLTFTGEVDYSKNPLYYNNSPNKHPDYRMDLDAPINGYMSIAMDSKMTDGQGYKTKDIIQVGTDNLDVRTSNATKNVSDHLDSLKQSTSLSIRDQDLLDKLSEELETNKQGVIANKNSELFASNFNKIHENNLEVVTKHRIGMNLQTKIGVEDMSIDNLSKEFYLTMFHKFYNEPNTVVQEFLNKKAYNYNNITRGQHQDHLVEFANFLDNKS